MGHYTTIVMTKFWCVILRNAFIVNAIAVIRASLPHPPFNKIM